VRRSLSAQNAKVGRIVWACIVAGALVCISPSAASAQPLFVQQGPKLTAPEQEQVGGGFGAQVALSADGNTALVGDPGDNVFAGAVWTYVRSGSTWSQLGPKLTGPGEVGAGRFGLGVALSADGRTALISGATDDNYRGAAWVFTRSGSSWIQQGPKLTASKEGKEGAFGHGIALSADGNTALFSGELEPEPSRAGAVWVFTRSGSTWSEVTKLRPTDEVATAEFGWSLALSPDGTTALVGGPYETGPDGGENTGSAWAFTRSGSAWAQQGPKFAIYANGPEIGPYKLGWSVALSSDGNTALVGAPYEGLNTGAAWVFTRSAGVWAVQGRALMGTEVPEGTGFGWSLALSADGNTAFFGVPGFRPDGGALVFKRTGSTWAQQGSKVAGNEAEYFGRGGMGESVAFSGDATEAFISASGDNRSTGAAFAFGAVGHEEAPTVKPEGSPGLGTGTAMLPSSPLASGSHFNHAAQGILSAAAATPARAFLASTDVVVHRGGYIYLKVHCAAVHSPCLGRLSLRLRVVSFRARHKVKLGPLLAAGRFRIADGETTGIGLRLGSRARKMLAARKLLRATAAVFIQTGGVTDSQVTLRLARH
jgi:hypothetical protein